MAKKHKNDDIESDTDPIGMKPKRKGKPKGEQQLADLILQGRSDDVRIVTVHADPPKKKRRWLKWGLIGFGVLWVMSLFAPPKDKATPPAQVEQVAIRPTNTVQPTITPVSRATLTAQALIALDTARTQTAPTQTPIVDVVITSTPSEPPIGATMTADVGATIIAQALSSPTPSTTPNNVREITDTARVTSEILNVRICARTDCESLGQLVRGDYVDVTGSVDDGQEIEGTRVWYQVQYNGQVGYVTGAFVSLASVEPPSAPIVRPVATAQNNAISPIQPTQPIVAPVSNWSCSGDEYNCTDFGAGKSLSCQQLYEYMSACPNDPSRLDRDRDGRFCETQCG